MGKFRTRDAIRSYDCWNVNSRTASGTLTAAPSGPGVFGAIIHLGGPPTDLGIFDNTTASGENIAYISGASAGQTYEFNTPFNVGLSVFVSGASRIAVKYVYD